MKNTYIIGKKNLRVGTGPSQSYEHATFKMARVSISCHWQEGREVYEGEPWHPNCSLKPSLQTSGCILCSWGRHTTQTPLQLSAPLRLHCVPMGSTALSLLGMLSALGTLWLIVFCLSSTHFFCFLLNFRACVHQKALNTYARASGRCGAF